MKYQIFPYSKAIEPFCYFYDLFTREELDYLQNFTKQNQQQDASVGSAGAGAVLPHIRRSKVGWMPYSEQHTWVYDRLAHAVSDINSKFYNFSISGFGEDIQLTNYNSNDNGMYGWHVDYNSGNLSRKLSVVVQLSDPSEYEGGNLQLKPFSDEPMTVNKQRGLVTIFPSFVLHQVTPVVSGSRQTLVCWITGEAFR